MSIYSHGNRRVSTVIHSKRTGHFFKRCYRRLNLWEVRSILPWYRWFYNCLVVWHVCYLCSLAAYCVWSLTGSIRPLFVFQSWHSLPWELPESFPVLQIFGLCWNEASFKPERAWFLILEHRRKWKLRKYANCIRLMRNSSWIKRRKGNCFTLYGSLFGLPAFIHKTRGDVFPVSNKVNRQT